MPLCHVVTIVSVLNPRQSAGTSFLSASPSYVDMCTTLCDPKRPTRVLGGAHGFTFYTKSNMRTLLSQFCESFESVVRPILEPLNGAAQAFENSQIELGGLEVRAGLIDLRHQVEGLVQKVVDQQAYVLLFGPLKSGKSTLMNALSSTYVSEVSSLPAYPCMVYLSHAEKREFDVTRYNGRTERFSDPASLYMYINRAHVELAERLRAAEARSEEFEPSLHYPEAIRKVDVRLPAGDLARSGAVLVDTPGLYSRMKFGYDRMTREFRDSASCAIFIVKSDNLFLEQVFEEFEELLQLFSRIFLVVNLDSSKTDLAYDGSLIPSLEREDPLALIDAFESLAMSAPLKTAAEEGRLRIYPIDLLKAASSRLKGSTSEDQASSRANFDVFLRDLTEYLNSTDYLVAFLGDSLRRASHLMDETAKLMQHEQVSALREGAEKLEADRQDSQRRRHAVGRLVGYDWRQAFLDLEDRLSPSIRERAKAASVATERDLDSILNRWFQCDDSLQTLVVDQLTPAFTKYQDTLTRFVQQTLSEEVLAGTAGILLPTNVSADLYAAGVDLSAIGRDALATLGREIPYKNVGDPLQTAAIPIKRRLIDWFLLRSTSKVRTQILGAAEQPALRIPVEVKNKRIGAEGRDVMRQELDRFKGRFFHETVVRAHRHVVGEYGTSAVTNMEAALKTRDTELDVQLTQIVSDLMEHRKVLAHMAALSSQLESAIQGIQGLTEQYSETEPTMLIQPAPPMQRPMNPKPAAESAEAPAPSQEDKLDAPSEAL
ncbi:MAG: GTPase SAR1 family protein [Planctomycetota bacterium]|jgi:GTPase SAR1 family protein